MLNVALHHPEIKKRMTKEEFGKNNLLAVTDKSLLNLMHNIYDRIAESEILLDSRDKNNNKRIKKETAFSGFARMNGLYIGNNSGGSSGNNSPGSYLEQRN